MEALVSGGGLNLPGEMECGHRQTVGSEFLGERAEVSAGCWGAEGRSLQQDLVLQPGGHPGN